MPLDFEAWYIFIMSIRVPRCFFLIVFLMTFSVHFLNHTILSEQHSHGQTHGHSHQEEQSKFDTTHSALALSQDIISELPHKHSSHSHANFQLASFPTLDFSHGADALWASSFSSQAFLDAYFASPSQQQAHSFYPNRWQARDLHRPQLASVILTI